MAYINPRINPRVFLTSRAGWILFSTALTLISVLFLYSFLTTRWIDNFIDRWIENQRATGVILQIAERHWHGFPFHNALILDGVQVENPKDAWSWAVEQIRIEPDFWDLTRYQLSTTSDQIFRIPFVIDTQTKIMDIVAESSEVRLNLDISLSGGQQTTLLQLRDTRLTSPHLATEVGFASLDIHHHADSPLLTTQTRQKIRITSHDVILPSQLFSPLGHHIETALLEMTFTGMIPKATFEETMITWRHNNGTATADHLQLNWGALQATGTGRLGLDAQFRPNIDLVLQTQGYKDVLKTLADQGLVKNNIGELLGFGLHLFASRDPQGKTVDIPIRIEKGRFFVGPFQLGHMPSLFPHLLSKPPGPSS